MLKKNGFLILVLILSAQWASGRSFVNSHEDYAHLSESDQQKMIIKVMELATELEARYEKDVEVYGFNQERFQKYQEAITKFTSLFIDSAHAQPGKKDWKKYGNEFISLLKKPDSRCIYAGWVSSAKKDKSGKTVCSHPGSQTESAQGCKKGDPKKVQCNPVIFGYKKESDKSLFCVDATNGAHNSSYNCMKEALAVGADQKGDDKTSRLNNLKERLAQNPEIFKGVQEFVYKTCVCEETDKKVNFNADYHKYMRPHRTCYGLMEMIAEVAICEDPKLVTDLKIFKGLRDHTKNKIVSEKDADALYTNFLNNEVKKVAPEEFARLCGEPVLTTTTTPPVESPPVVTPPTEEPPIQQVVVTAQKEYTCSATCEPISDKDRPYECSFVVRSGNDKEVTLDDAPMELPGSGEDKKISISNKINKKEVSLTCDLTIKEKKPETPAEGTRPTLKITEKESTADNLKLEAVVTDQGEWQIVWKTIKVTKKTVAKKSKNDFVAQSKDSSQDDKDKDKDPKKDPKSDDTVVEEKAGATEFSAPREDSSYKVCAELRKGSDSIPATPDCVEVKEKGKAKEEAKPSSSGGPFTPPPMQQPMIRNQFDSFSEGVR